MEESREQRSGVRDQRSSPGFSLSLPRSGSDLIKLSAKRLNGMVSDWGSADLNRGFELQFTVQVVAPGTQSLGIPQRGCRGRAKSLIPQFDEEI